MTTEAVEIKQRAEAMVAAHPLGEVLENTFFGAFAVLGGAIGYLWRALYALVFHSYKLGFVIFLAFSDGFKKTAKAPAKPLPQIEPPLQAGAAQLLDDDRIVDNYTTPFGIPFGPNVHASHE